MHAIIAKISNVVWYKFQKNKEPFRSYGVTVLVAATGLLECDGDDRWFITSLRPQVQNSQKSSGHAGIVEST